MADYMLERNKQGNCARGCCQQPMNIHGKWYNKGSLAWYCTDCAKLINRMNLDVAPEGLCTREEYGTAE